LQRSFWAKYIEAYLLTANDTPIGSATSVFEEPIIGLLRSYVSDAALSTPILFTERLSNRVVAACINLHDNSSVIAINARLKCDPELLAHALIEELIHAQQQIEGLDFEAQRRQFAYEDRPYELMAKRIATDVLGYEPEACEVYLLRNELEETLDTAMRG
jgi:hypothetical protein